MVFKFRPLRTGIRADALFTRPILEWERVSSRFFAMVYDALAGKTNPSVAEFSVDRATVLGEARARYRLFGGAHLAGVSVRRVEDITEALWGTRVPAN
jgi:hypothetical protein